MDVEFIKILFQDRCDFMNTKKTAVVTGGTKDQVSAMAVLALNIADKCPNIADELVIYHDGISRNQQKKIQKIFPTRFIKYIAPWKDKSSFSDTVLYYFSPMVFCKYECFKLLDEYETVIWTDYDVLIKKDISFIQELSDKSEFLFDHSSDILYSFKDTFDKNKYSEYDFSKPGVSLAYFVLRKNFIDYNKFYDWCINATYEFAPYLSLPEQAVINLAFQKFKSDVYEIENLDRRYALHPRDVPLIKEDDIVILHCYGSPKFWSGLENAEWNAYYNRWINDYKGKKIQKVTFFSRVIKKIKKVWHVY